MVGQEHQLPAPPSSGGFVDPPWPLDLTIQVTTTHATSALVTSFSDPFQPHRHATRPSPTVRPRLLGPGAPEAASLDQGEDPGLSAGRPGWPPRVLRGAGARVPRVFCAVLLVP